MECTGRSVCWTLIVAVITCGCSVSTTRGDAQLEKDLSYIDDAQSDTIPVDDLLYNYNDTVNDSDHEIVEDCADPGDQIELNDFATIEAVTEIDGVEISLETEVEPDSCHPACQGRQCGPDGCGSECGICSDDQICLDGQCACESVDCDDQCCDAKEVCFHGQCCLADCAFAECGSDGCGGMCGDCIADEICHPTDRICVAVTTSVHISGNLDKRDFFMVEEFDPANPYGSSNYAMSFNIRDASNKLVEAMIFFGKYGDNLWEWNIVVDGQTQSSGIAGENIVLGNGQLYFDNDGELIPNMELDFITVNPANALPTTIFIDFGYDQVSFFSVTQYSNLYTLDVVVYPDL
ncbi:MAG: flagellar basal body FlgE domain-containing protein [Patescibacteria group bacterium]